MNVSSRLETTRRPRLIGVCVVVSVVGDCGDDGRAAWHVERLFGALRDSGSACCESTGNKSRVVCSTERTTAPTPPPSVSYRAVGLFRALASPPADTSRHPTGLPTSADLVWSGHVPWSGVWSGNTAARYVGRAGDQMRCRALIKLVATAAAATAQGPTPTPHHAHPHPDRHMAASVRAPAHDGTRDHPPPLLDGTECDRYVCLPIFPLRRRRVANPPPLSRLRRLMPQRPQHPALCVLPRQR